MTELAKGILDLSPTKLALLETLFRESGIEVSTTQIPRRTSTESPALSFAQQRLWFLDQLLPGMAFYNIPAAVRVRLPLQVEVLQRSLSEVVRRHEALRTHFAVVEGQPVQVVAPTLEVPLTVTDLRALPAEAREAEAARLAREASEAPFDLARGPLLRGRVLQLGAADYVLVLVLHHIVTDGWSMGVLFRELTALYGAYGRGAGSPLAELPIQYADYAVWQRQWLRGEVRQRQVAYWRTQLADAPVLALPTDRPRPAVQQFRGAQQAVQLGAALTAGVRQLSQRHGVTLFMTLLAAFQTLLHRYTGQSDIVVGSPIAGRTRAELEGLIGFFVNTLVLRTDVSGDPSFAALLARVQAVALGAYAHQDLPFEMLVEELQPERDLSRNPLFQVSFQLLNTPTMSGLASAREDASIALPVTTSKFDLALDLVDLPDGAGVEGRFEYNTDLFDAATIEQLAAHFVRLLEGIVADPTRRVSRYALLSASERQQQLVTWNTTATAYPRERGVQTLFEAQVQRQPDAVAVTYEGATLTYGALNARANQLAHYLRGQGVGPEVPVGIYLERSPEMVVALLAVLKAGGAYVPLDVTYPPDRIAFMLADSSATVIVTTDDLAAGLPGCGATIISVDRAFEESSAENLESLTTAESLAYIMYTSGSTGLPKGSCIPHRAVTRLVCNTNYLQLGPNDCVAQISNSSFDAATFEIWGALLNGARLVGISKSTALLASELGATLERHGITALFVTTSLFNQLVAEVPAVFRSVRSVLVGGSACDTGAMRAVLQHGPPERLVHVYGPTENTTFTTWDVIRDVPPRAVTVPIGRPIANTQVFILDEHLQPVPLGVAGELHIGGDGLARGYLNRAQLTAEKFVAHPFSENPNDRLYRTGDRVRYLRDGDIVFLSRFDDQVKIRGFRVEPGEVETVLRAHPSVRQAIVIARASPAYDARLIAYVVGDGEANLATELRALVTSKLPEYMVPTAFVVLDALPLSPNGKVDRGQLPEPARTPPIDSAVAEPSTDMERAIAALWREVLGLENVGVTDNFFDLGGHSLLLVRVHSRLRRLATGELSMTDLFRYTTIRALAAHLSHGPRETTAVQRGRDRAEKQRAAIAARMQRGKRV